MCGIAGIVGSLASKETISLMCQAIAHRGPDNIGTYHNKDVALGHTRLSIIDLSSAGDQPISDSKNEVFIIFNGEIYNYKSLKTELLDKGIEFKGNSDTEVILQMYLNSEDNSFIEKLNGIFAFAIWDSRKKKLLLARDHFGIKPLHYYFDGKNLVFGSEIKSILASKIVKPKLNRQALHDSLNVRYIPGEQTLFKNIHRMKPSSYIEYDEGGMKMKEYYSLNSVVVANDYSQSDIIDGIRSTFEKSVENQLVSDVPVGVYLSGGLDSSAITYYYRKLREESEIPTFTLGFNSEVDEVPDAKIMSDFCKTKQHVFNISNDPLSRMEELIWHTEEPKINAMQGYLLAEQAKQYVKVVHGGLGGDELFTGYKYHEYMNSMGSYYNNLPYGLINKLSSPISSLLSSIQIGSGALLYDEVRRGAEMITASDPVLSYLIPRNAWDNNQKSWDLLYSDNFKEIQPVRRNYEQYFSKDRDFLGNVLWAEFHTKMINDLLLNDDRVSMAHGLEVRVPLLDRELVEFAFSIPSKMKMKKGETKHLMKLALKEFLPEKIMNKPKAGFQFSSYQQYISGLKVAVEQRLTKKRVEEIGIFNYSYIRKILDTKPNPQLRWHYFLLWQMLGFDIWHKLFIEEQNFNQRPLYNE